MNAHTLNGLNGLNAYSFQIFFVGDELVAGMGDARGMGWVGRVLARTPVHPPIMPYVLAFAGESSAQLMERWKSDVSVRLSKDHTNRLVIALGSHDLDAGLSSARSRLHLANILDMAERMQLNPFVVGPPPRPDKSERAVAELSHSFSDVCTRRSIPYVDTFTPLIQHEQWNTDMSLAGTYTPRQAGYGLIAWLVLHRGWHQWLGIKATDDDAR
ncbi:MAG: GDSL-type esterase/lipase family protein [Actinomycetaceae bacterium]|nr:GDSL-type esterase/lipase family protein [Arcanobacterium sp.]MDD7686927.1 GDSL-type esterase/lipase family protein [Actinomycetaceae bacterium]MDY5273752.1 GDSL-type esterase/lipase family protein [Arcanobacterium sp.]